METIDKKEFVVKFKDSLKNHLNELVNTRERHIEDNDKKSIELYDRMIDNTLDNINKMNRILERLN